MITLGLANVYCIFVTTDHIPFVLTLLDRLERYITTADNQFGFKRKHGTDMCISALKDIIAKYRSHNSTMFLCFIDASRAFDRLNHFKLFDKMCQRGLPKYIIRIVAFSRLCR